MKYNFQLSFSSLGKHPNDQIFAGWALPCISGFVVFISICLVKTVDLYLINISSKKTFFIEEKENRVLNLFSKFFHKTERDSAIEKYFLICCSSSKVMYKSLLQYRKIPFLSKDIPLLNPCFDMLSSPVTPPSF